MKIFGFLIELPFFFPQGIYVSKAVPYAIIGALSLLSAFLIFRLPETHNKALTDIIEHTGEFEKHEKTTVASETIINLATTREDKKEAISTCDGVIVESEIAGRVLEDGTHNKENAIVTSDEVTAESRTAAKLPECHTDKQATVITNES